MRIDQAKSIPLDEFLKKLGHTFIKEKAGRKWYRRPYGNERTASFVISQDKMAFYDHGSGSGGNIIDLAKLIAKVDSVSEALMFIESTVGASFQFVQPQTRVTPTDVPAYQVVSTMGFLPDANLTHSNEVQWLKKRAIEPSVVAPFVKYVTFCHKDLPNKKYQGIGLPNVAGGYELRDTQRGFIKLSVGPKNISFFPATAPGFENANLHIFEGAPDFWTYLTWNNQKPQPIHPATESYLILNGTGMIGEAISYLKELRFKFVAIWGQYGNAGLKAEEELLDFFRHHKCPVATTKELYALPADIKPEEISQWDFNAWWMKQNNKHL